MCKLDVTKNGIKCHTNLYYIDSSWYAVWLNRFLTQVGNL